MKKILNILKIKLNKFIFKTNITIIIIFIFIIFYQLNSYAEFEEKGAGVRSSSMGNAYVALSNEGDGIYYNPAGLAKIKRAEFTSMHTSLYSQSELSYDVFNIIQPMMPFSVIGFGYSRFGSDIYIEKEILLSMSRYITNKHSFGLTLKQLSVDIENTPKRDGFSMDFGFLVDLEKNFSFGLSVINLNNPKMNELVPKTYKGGFMFSPNENLIFCFDVSKQSGDKKYNFSIGEEFKMTRNFKLRAGYSTYPVQFSTGFGFEFKNIRLDYAFKNHDTLNSTHRVSFTYMMD